jgi:hypothetical protein
MLCDFLWRRLPFLAKHRFFGSPVWQLVALFQLLDRACVAAKGSGDLVI